MICRTVLNCVTVLFYFVLVATWVAHACNEETSREGTSKFGVYLPKKWGILYYEVPCEDLSSSVRVRPYKGLVPTRKLYFIEELRGSVSGIPEEAVMWSVCVTENDSIHLWSLLPLYPADMSHNATVTVTRFIHQWRTELHWPGKWVEERIVNSLFPSHCDGNNWNNHYKRTRYGGNKLIE